MQQCGVDVRVWRLGLLFPRSQKQLCCVDSLLFSGNRGAPVLGGFGHFRYIPVGLRNGDLIAYFALFNKNPQTQRLCTILFATCLANGQKFQR